MNENNISQVLRENLIFLRRKHHMTQEQLAGKLGLTFQAVSKWETGVSCPDIALLPQLAEIFGVTVDQFFHPLANDVEEMEKLSTPSAAPPEFGPENSPEPSSDTAPEDSSPQSEDSLHSKGRKSISEWVRSVMGGAAPQDLSDFVASTIDFTLSSSDQEDEDATVEDRKFSDGRIEDVPWEDDGVYRAVLFRGRSLVAMPEENGKLISADDLDNSLLSAFRVECGDISGSVTASGDVSCGDVGGALAAGRDISCGDAGGNLSAGRSIECGDVAGSVSAGNSVTCGDVSGNVSCQKLGR